MIELHHLLNYKNYKIYQNDEWFEFSLDSVVLAKMTTVLPRTKKILDIGTGNAPIPIILTTRTKAEIDALEIQKDLYELAVKSVNINKLESQIKVINADATKWYKDIESDTYDIITCNPPYFKYNNTSFLNEDVHKTIARHEVSLNTENVIEIAKKLLKNNGILSMINRTERMPEIIELLKKHNFEAKKIIFIYPKENTESNLFMIEASKNGKPGLKVLSPLIVHNDDGSYREEIKKLFTEEV